MTEHELYKNPKKIKAWLDQHNVKKYILVPDEQYGFMVNVEDSVLMAGLKIKKIKVKFHEVKGRFDVEANELQTLKGCPEIVNGHFDCSHNELKDLKYCPQIIKGDFLCYSNHLNSIEYCPQMVHGHIDYYDNPELGEIEKIKDFDFFKKKAQRLQDIKQLKYKLDEQLSHDGSGHKKLKI